MVLSSLKTQDTTSNEHLSRDGVPEINRVRDDVDEIETQTELIDSKNDVT